MIQLSAFQSTSISLGFTFGSLNTTLSFTPFSTFLHDNHRVTAEIQISPVIWSAGVRYRDINFFPQPWLSGVGGEKG